ncbi:MAG: hypothetical protein RBU29_16820, partial [bacterium]|nr:hypothetical protein [bacterium]
MNKAALGLLVCFCMTSLMASAEPQEGSLFPAHLRCEYKENPLGIDILHPRLSWEAEAITATERGLKQNSYQIVIASSLALLEQNIGDFWDTGKVQSSQTTHILYNGKTPASNQDFYWKVRIWDQDDARSAWSRPARWSTGLLSPGDWQAQWIEQPFRTDFDQCQWIWFPEGNPTQQAPAGTVYFRKTFTLDSPASEARILLTGDDYFTLYLDGQKILQSPQHEDAWDSPQIVDLGSLGSGKHCLAIAVTNKTESPAGLTAKLMLLENQTQMTLLTDASWKVSKEEAP